MGSQRQELKSSGLRRLLSSPFVIHVPGYIMGKVLTLNNPNPPRLDVKLKIKTVDSLIWL